MSIDVSIVMPTYNRVSMLKEALDSVFSQDFEGTFEVIVVDDCSQDETSEIVARDYPAVHLISLKQNVGHGAARNQGIKFAKGKYIAFLDSDDLWKPNYLQVQIEALKGRDRSIALSGIEMFFLLSDRRVIFTQKPDLDKYMSPIHQMLIAYKHYVPSGPSAFVFPRYIFDEVGLFEERFRFGIDIDMYLRCLGAGFSTIFTELPLVIKREGAPDQLTKPKNLKPREKSVFSRIDNFYKLYGIANKDIIPPIRHIYAESYLAYAEIYFKNNDLLNGLRSSLAAAHNGSHARALSSAAKGIMKQPYYVTKRIIKQPYYAAKRTMKQLS